MLSASFTCPSQWQASSRLRQQSVLCSRYPQASTRRTKLSCKGRPLHKWESGHPIPTEALVSTAWGQELQTYEADREPSEEAI